MTGIGVVSPVGIGREAFWTALLAGASGVKPVAAFDTAHLAVHAGAEVGSFDLARYVTEDRAAPLGPTAKLAVAAGGLALEDAGLDGDTAARARTGVVVGTTLGESRFVDAYNDLRREIPQAVGLPALLSHYPSHTIPADVAQTFGFGGRAIVLPTACAGGNYAIGYAFDLIRSGRADVMLAGGADTISRVTYVGFARLGVIAAEYCRPFDKNRTGMIPGEGAALLVLERLDMAQARGATIYAEVLGYGASCDAHHMTAGAPHGEGAMRAMESALRESGISAGDIGYISAHGVGTPINDRLECLALQGVFGENAGGIPMSSIKAAIGHTMGAACGFDAAASSLALATGWVPPTMNYEVPDPDCAFDVVPNAARRVDPRFVISNANAFGGNNAALCLGRYPL